MEHTNTETRKHVVIVGGGFAGLHCAMQLAKTPAIQVTLIDRNNYQQFQPLMYQVATAILNPSNAAFNLRSVLSQHENVDIVLTEAVSADLASKTVACSNGEKYAGDYLVLAAGAQANFFDTPGAVEYAFPLYTLRDAEKLRSRILEILEKADAANGAGEDHAPHFAVVGGGATGVEISGAIADILQRAPETTYKHLDMKRVTTTLINGKDEVLSGFTPKSQEYAKKVLSERHVQMLLGKQVREVTSSALRLSDDVELDCDLAIWAGGIKAAGLAQACGVKTGKGGRIDVGPDLQIAGFPQVYALGDFANISGDDGKPLPQLGSVAQQAGHHCGKNIAASVEGKEAQPFKYLDKGIMAMIGRNAAVAEVGAGHHSLTGPIAFAAWLGVHAVLLTTVRAKIGTFFEWAWEYFRGVPMEAILDWSGTDSGPLHPVGEASGEAKLRGDNGA